MKEEIKRNCEKREEYLSEYATKSSEAIRLVEEKEDLRPAFFHDTDRIMHSMSFTRYIDKTQVFSYLENDHVSKRIIHVNLVSKIARTIGRFLSLNEDLIEAIALAHDIGHTPLGHFGESCLDEISMKYLAIPFMHNIQSVRTYLILENNGKGSNLTIQTLDGAMCHNGEMLNNVYEPINKTKEEFINDYEESIKSKDYASKIRPMTIEGCVVRISDVIAYIGRDIEDAVRIKKTKREDIPESISKVLGATNKEIVNSIIKDIVANSINKPYIKLSDKVFNAVNELKKYNYEKIYYKAETKENLEYYREGFNRLYLKYLSDLNNNNIKSIIYESFLKDMNKNYINTTNNEQIVIDFIAGMTDDFFLKEYKDIGKNC